MNNRERKREKEREKGGRESEREQSQSGVCGTCENEEVGGGVG